MSVRGLSLRDALRRAFHLQDPPWRVALAVALGVFIGCTPFWFFQTGLALALAWLLRLPKLAAVTGVWLNFPWIAPVVYAFALQLGSIVVGKPGAPADALAALLADPDLIGRGEATALAEEMGPALLVGTTLVGAVAAVVAFGVVLLVLRTRRRGAAERARRSRAA